MTEKSIIECDGPDCDETEPMFTGGEVPPDWGLLINGNGTTAHLCPEDAREAWLQNTKAVEVGPDE